MKTYTYKLKPNKTQERLLWQTLRLSRVAYNGMLQELIDHYNATGKHLNQFSHDKLHSKKEHPDIPSTIVDTTLTRLHNSFANFFKGIKSGRKVGFPRFKSGNHWHSLQFRDATINRVVLNRFKAGKILGGDIKFIRHRETEGILKFCRILRKPSGWYLQCVCDTVPQHILPATGKEVGLDMGIKSLVADSDGLVTPNPKHLNKSLKRLRRAQRHASRCKKGSQRRRKACRRTARIHEKVACQRSDFSHKISRYYVNNYDTIVVEDLSITQMMKNGYMARGISDAAWGMLIGQIDYKAEEAGRRFIKKPPYYTSQECNECGNMVEKSLSVRTHVCPQCGNTADRDVNAAKNILRLGTRLRDTSSAIAKLSRETTVRDLVVVHKAYIE